MQVYKNILYIYVHVVSNHHLEAPHLDYKLIESLNSRVNYPVSNLWIK